MLPHDCRHFRGRFAALYDGTLAEYPRPLELSHDLNDPWVPLPEGVELVVSNMAATGESNFRVRLAFLNRHVVCEGAVPRCKEAGQLGYFTYYSPPAEDDGGGQLMVAIYERPHQRLTVRVEDEADGLLMEAELDNTNFYETGLRTELHWVLDGGALTLDVWVPWDRVNRPASP